MIVALLASLASVVHAQDKPGKFTDPEDGKFDMSQWLLGRTAGFLPVPVVITDPAVGNGGGLFFLFFRAQDTPTDDAGKPIAPDIYGIGTARTENGTEFTGGGANLHFARDRWRYRGGIAKTSLFLDYYTSAGGPVPEQRIGYNADGKASLQQVSRRIGKRGVYAGLVWIWMDIDVAFDVPADRDRFDSRERSKRSSGLGAVVEYDGRDNPFTPSDGWYARLEAVRYAEAIGSDNDFQTGRGYAWGFWPIGERVVAAGRADMRWADGDVPFYRLPYIDLRGIGAARYQDRCTLTLETEWRWNMTPRWATVAFVGAGRTWGQRNAFADAKTHAARGLGVRYLIARALGMYVGLDYAWGPEDGTFYVQVGSAWH